MPRVQAGENVQLKEHHGMSRFLWAVLAFFLAAGASLEAAERAPLGPYFASDNIDYIDHIPLQNDTAGARILGKYMYVTTSRELSIYDLSNPLRPKRVGSTFSPQLPYFPQEDVDTNGKIVLVGSINGTLNVINVEDKTNPQVVGRVDGGAGHTNTCLLDCTYSYGAEGQVVDLRDPANPTLIGNWKKHAPPGSTHDVTEVAPGMVVTSGPLALLDARNDPRMPRLRAYAHGGPGGITHSNLWPRRMKDRFLMVSGEGGGPRCGENSASFSTWDTRGWQRTRTFKELDRYTVKSGTYTDGDAAVNPLCMHWFDDHPDFRDGGLVAVAVYEHGTKILEVEGDGSIRPVGYFLPAGGSTSAAYWVTDRIIYTADYNRGIDIIRVEGARNG